ncbi:MAG: hypothetical protein IT331_13275 [Anaerolineae bacterium]|nr:hypothetical protein [Anaerolineae bacterium]
MSQTNSLNSQHRYEIKLYGQPDAAWLDLIGAARVRALVLPDNDCVTTISDLVMDQSGMVGLIRRLHGHGFVLISIHQV